MGGKLGWKSGCGKGCSQHVSQCMYVLMWGVGSTE